MGAPRKIPVGFGWHGGPRHPRCLASLSRAHQAQCCFKSLRGQCALLRCLGTSPSSRYALSRGLEVTPETILFAYEQSLSRGLAAWELLDASRCANAGLAEAVVSEATPGCGRSTRAAWVLWGSRRLQHLESPWKFSQSDLAACRKHELCPESVAPQSAPVADVGADLPRLEELRGAAVGPPPCAKAVGWGRAVVAVRGTLGEVQRDALDQAPGPRGSRGPAGRRSVSRRSALADSLEHSFLEVQRLLRPSVPANAP